MKLTTQSIANATAVTAAVLWAVCAFVAIAFPGLYQLGANLLAFGNVGHLGLSLSNAILGGALFTAVAWVSGYLFGWNLEHFSKN